MKCVQNKPILMITNDYRSVQKIKNVIAFHLDLFHNSILPVLVNVADFFQSTFNRYKRRSQNKVIRTISKVKDV